MTSPLNAIRINYWEGNPLVTGGFPSQRDNDRGASQCSFRCHCNVYRVYFPHDKLSYGEYPSRTTCRQCHVYDITSLLRRNYISTSYWCNISIIITIIGPMASIHIIATFSIVSLSNRWFISIYSRYYSPYNSCSHKSIHVYISIDHSVYGLSQWETTLQCNVVSHWLEPITRMIPDKCR